MNGTFYSTITKRLILLLAPLFFSLPAVASVGDIHDLLGGDLSSERFLEAARQSPFTINPDFVIPAETLATIRTYKDLRAADFELSNRESVSPSFGPFIADYDKARTGILIRALNRLDFAPFAPSPRLASGNNTIPFFQRLLEFKAADLPVDRMHDSRVRRTLAILARYGVPFVTKASHSSCGKGDMLYSSPTIEALGKYLD